MKNDESASNGGASSRRTSGPDRIVMEARVGIERTDRTGAIEFIGVATARKAQNRLMQKRAQI